MDGRREALEHMRREVESHGVDEGRGGDELVEVALGEAPHPPAARERAREREWEEEEQARRVAPLGKRRVELGTLADLEHVERDAAEQDEGDGGGEALHHRQLLAHDFGVRLAVARVVKAVVQPVYALLVRVEVPGRIGVISVGIVDLFGAILTSECR